MQPSNGSDESRPLCETRAISVQKWRRAKAMGKNRQFLSKHVRNEAGSFIEPEGEQFIVSFHCLWPQLFRRTVRALHLTPAYMIPSVADSF